MKKLVYALFLPFWIFAQQPYYNDVDLTKNGLNLKSELTTKITNTHTQSLSYTPGVWEACKVTDADPNNSNNVILVYGWENGTDGDTTNDRTRGKNENGGGTTQWNREHSYPKSLGNPNLGTVGPGADVHHLRASDVKRNSKRGSRFFADGSGNSGTVGTNWYPGDEWKGDVARMMMYMYVRYGNRCLPKNVTRGTPNTNDSNMINTLLEWNAEDPVSSIEDNRNQYHDSNATYAQGNRNPFIDNPNLATQIWGGPVAEDRWGNVVADTEAPTVPVNLYITNTTTNSIAFSWTASSDNVGVTGYDIYVNGNINSSSSNTATTITGLNPSTTYIFSVLAKDAAGNSSAKSSNMSGTTKSDGGIPPSSGELFISEYIEGSSNNKALEIANYTGATVSLSNYQLRLSSNGNRNWTATYKFPNGTSIVNGDVYVITHTSFRLSCPNACTADNKNGSITSFNGNDAIGLFKNNTLIDILGKLGNKSTYGANKTLIRKATVSTPNTTYQKSEWNTLPSNNCSDLGKHNITATTLSSMNSKELVSHNPYPNPSNNGTVYMNLSDNISEEANIRVYDRRGKLIRNFNTSQGQKVVTLSDLPKGVVFLQIITSKGTSTDKIIIQ